jgi:reverse transcriptase-like protein
VHVDNCTIAASSACLVKDFKAGLRRHIEVTNLGALHWMLGIEIRYDQEVGTVHLLQHVYIDSILCHYHLADLKPLSTPMDTSTWLTIKQAPASVAEHAIMRDVPYHKAVGTLNWAALTTHPDIAFTVMTIAHFAANPSPAHWNAVKCIYCYLAGTCNLWLLYRGTR